MPTLRMIGVHPDVCARLVVQPKPVVNNRSSSAADCAGNDDNATAPRPKRQRRMPTPKDVLTCPIDALRIVDKEKAIPVPLLQAARLRREIAQGLAAYQARQRQVSDADLARDSTGITTSFVSTYCGELDQLLAPQSNHPGGIPCGLVTCITGPPASGKTQFCCHVIASHNTTARSSATTWLLCSGPVNSHISRLEQLTAVNSGATQIRNFANEWEVMALLTEVEITLEQECRQQKAANKNGTYLLLLDSLGHLNCDCQLQQVQIGDRLRSLARRFSMAIVVVEPSNDRSMQQPNDQRTQLGDVRLRFDRHTSNDDNNTLVICTTLEHHSAMAPASLPTTCLLDLISTKSQH